ncbi:fungal-specific transcription factor domain-containing protein [Exophiala viscosa]|uniref:fungal-specific transcription factor domain-containing protein n=1 Tax=Exophiala viscosa TaxID=2486360 RepID=UPI00218E61A3|nr:fungal-specific transcription factor domain-containing protein [Exophiala viscosa]
MATRLTRTRELIECKSSVAELQNKNGKLVNLLTDVLAATTTESEARSRAVQFLTEDPEYEGILRNARRSESGTEPIPREAGQAGPFTTGQDPHLVLETNSEHPSQTEHKQWRSPGAFNLVGMSRLSQKSQRILTDDTPPTSASFPPAAWTSATDNDNLVQHLLSLYFCWEYPVFASLSREHFLLDFNSGRGRYCSPLLVNAILALGARFSDIPEAWKDRHSPETAGDQFYEEAQRLLGVEDVPTLTKIQALGLMSLRQASRGNDASAWQLSRWAVRSAIDLGLHLGESQDTRANRLLYSNAERQVSAATFWGCYTLEQAWCLTIGRQSQLRPEEIHVTKPLKIDEIEDEPWVPYNDEGVNPDTTLHQRSNLRSVYKVFAELSGIVHQTNTILLSDDTRSINAHVRALYTEYLQFYNSLPDALRLGGNSTPPVFFAHMYFHYAILLLFRPFYNTGVGDTVTVTRVVCNEATDNILSLVRSYKNIYTLRRTPAFLPYVVLTAELGRMADHRTGDHRSEIYHTASLRYLKELALSHPFAIRAIRICRYFRRGWRIEASPEDELDLPEVNEEAGDGVAMSHEVTFFRPDVDLERHHEGVPHYGPMRDLSRNTNTKRFVLFPLQGISEGTMNLEE